METLKNATTNKIPKYNNTLFSLLDGIRCIGNRRSIAFRAVHEFFMLFFLSSCSLTLSYYWTARYTHSVLFLPMVRGSYNHKKRNEKCTTMEDKKTKRDAGDRQEKRRQNGGSRVDVLNLINNSHTTRHVFITVTICGQIIEGTPLINERGCVSIKYIGFF